MATSVIIAPTVGEGCIFTQQGPGSSPGYGAIDLRRSLLEGPQEGVIAGTDAEALGWLVEAQSSPDLSVKLRANVACARVKGDSATQQGFYTVAPHASEISLDVASNSSGNPRVDIVILEVLDNVHDASGLNLARVRVITGTPDALATLASRTGAPSLPSNAILLADLLRASGDTAVSNSEIRDRRPWARGAHYRKVYVGGDLSANSTPSEITSTGLKPRLELSGAPLLVEAWGSQYNSPGGNFTGLWVLLDGAVLTGEGTSFSLASHSDCMYQLSAGASREAFRIGHEFVPSAGSHQISIGKSANSGTTSIDGNADHPLVLTVRELVRGSLENNSVTSG